MSFILDALKKSEAERQQRTGPTLLEPRAPRRRRQYPRWVWGLAVLLIANGALLGVYLWRDSAAHAPAPETGVHPSAPPPAVVVTQGVAPPGPAAPQPVVAAPAPVSNGVPPIVAAAPEAAEGGEPGDSPSDNPADHEPAVAPHTMRTVPGSSAASGAPESSSGFGPVHVERTTPHDYSALPASTEVTGNLPPLRLDLHAYADRPADRYALINMHRVREGDTVPEGGRVIAITREGVAMEYQGREFMLRPQ